MGLRHRWPGFLVHLVVGEILRKFSYKQVQFRLTCRAIFDFVFVLFQSVQLWHISAFVLFAGSEIGFAGAIVIISIIFLYKTATLSTQKLLVWLTTCLILLILNASELVFEKNTILNVLQLNDNNFQDLIVAAHWTVLRCISYSFDEKNKSNVLDLLSYCLYLPLFFFGPFIRFEHFKQSFKENKSITMQNKIKQLLLNLFRFNFWLLFTELSLHFVYVNATMYHPDFVKNLDSWSLYGYGYAMGQFFHLKYVVMYGIATTLAKFDNVQTPKTPCCIGRVHLYSQMWRQFDPGLYTFLTR